MKYSFVRFLLVGIVNTIVGLSSIYLFLKAAGFSYWLSTFLGNSLGACVSYFLNKRFTFKSQNSVAKSSVRFVLVILVSYFISYDLAQTIAASLLKWMNLFTEKTSADLAVLGGTGLYTILNYFGQKMFVFQESSEKVKELSSK